MHSVKISPSVRIPSVVLTYARMSLVCTVFFHHPRSSSPRACMALCVRAPLHLEVEQLHSPSCCMFCRSHRVSSHPVAELQISCVCLTTPCRSARATGNLCFLGEKKSPIRTSLRKRWQKMCEIWWFSKVSECFGSNHFSGFPSFSTLLRAVLFFFTSMNKSPHSTLGKMIWIWSTYCRDKRVSEYILIRQDTKLTNCNLWSKSKYEALQHAII